MWIQHFIRYLRLFGAVLFINPRDNVKVYLKNLI